MGKTVVDGMQSLFKEPQPPFQIINVDAHTLTKAMLLELLASRVPGSHIIGCSASYRPQHQTMRTVAFATPTMVIQVPVTKHHNFKIIEEVLLLNHQVVIAGCDMECIAVGLRLDANFFMSNGIDLQDIYSHETSNRRSLDIFLKILGGAEAVDRMTVMEVFCDLQPKDNYAYKAALRAWALCIAAHDPTTRRLMETTPRVSTVHMEPKVLSIVCKLHRQGSRLDAMKPTMIKNDVSRDAVSGEGTVTVVSERYKTRVQKGSGQVVLLELHNGESIEGHVKRVQGRSAIIESGTSAGSGIKSAITVGKEDPTRAQVSRNQTLLSIMQASTRLAQTAAFRAVWLPERRRQDDYNDDNEFSEPPEEPEIPEQVTVKLNDSQKSAIRAVLRDVKRGSVDAQLVLGPPGTGKTSVIAACVQALRTSGRPIWIMADSNVAVKNVAQKLADIDFWAFRVVVSHDFHFEWHEHLYHKINDNVIVSNKFPRRLQDTQRIFGQTRVILCTVSMLSNDRLAESGLPELVPLENVIIDEASQIELGQYLTLVMRYGRTLRKLLFVGDDKQLAPYGHDDIPNLQSVFEIPEHRENAIFLNIQYRMPISIGRFISNQMYDKKLRSQHYIKDKSACQFVDVCDGCEGRVEGTTSWMNRAERDAVVDVARWLVERKKDFRAITPYDRQRSEIEHALQRAGLPWHDRVFNVDSFQGNEADYIIISVVRTTGAGFLDNERRTNVMLTRCKRGMFICSNRQFLEEGGGRATLVGRMAEQWGQITEHGGAREWLTTAQVREGDFDC